MKKSNAVVILMTLCLTIFLHGCSLYRPSLQQGNYISQAALDELKPNLSKHQVQGIMGTPALVPFFKLDQWNYSFAYLDGNHRDQPLKFHTLTLYFKHDRLQSYSSDKWHPPHLPKSGN